MSARLVIASPQNLTRDCYAPCPRINLTLRSNGEEAVQVMDALGNFYSAGLGNGPTEAPSIAYTAGTATFTANSFFCYRYVYVAKVLFPQVQAINTGGGSSAPKTNPSPSVTSTDTSDTKNRVLTIPGSTDTRFSHIWIYRTLQFVDSGEPDSDPQGEAETNSDAGNLYWIGEVENDTTGADVTFTDTGVEAQEQIENDNYPCPMFSLCLYAAPYFYGIGNRDFIADVSIDTDGIITFIPVNTPPEQWFDGRNGQFVKLDGINQGGYDGLGTFLFKWLSPTTAQLYDDLALTSAVDAGYTGTTRARVFGPTATLYRSKPNNPFAWGKTDYIADAQVPQPYAFALGVGRATSISILPSASLLKIDFEAPSQCVVLNLRNAGTDSFESSLRIVSQTFVASSQASQFLAVLEKGNDALWAYDMKSYSIVQCDGSSQVPISDKVYETLRGLSTGSDKLLYVHGIYHPRLELNLLFANDARSEDTCTSLTFYHHAPSGQWGMLDGFNVISSAYVVHPTTKERLVIVGTYEGMLGEFGAVDQFTHWTDRAPADSYFVSADPNFVAWTGALTLQVPTMVYDATDIGVWATLIGRESSTGEEKKLFMRIASGAGDQFTFDILLDENFAGLTNFPDWADPLTTTYLLDFYIGLISMEIGRFFTAKVPIANKKITEIWSSWIRDDNAFDPSYQIGATYRFGVLVRPLVLASASSPDDGNKSLYKAPGPFDITESRVVGLKFLDRNPRAVALMNYEIHMSPDAPN